MPAQEHGSTAAGKRFQAANEWKRPHADVMVWTTSKTQIWKYTSGARSSAVMYTAYRCNCSKLLALMNAADGLPAHLHALEAC